MMEGIQQSLRGLYRNRKVRFLVVKLKFSNFTRTTAERVFPRLDEVTFTSLLADEKDDPQMEIF